MVARKLLLYILSASLSLSLSAQKNIQDKKPDEPGNYTDLTFIDIGKVEGRGIATMNPSVITLKAMGSDIWGKHDEFLFGYKKIRGDFKLTAKISSLSPAHKYTKAGLMARRDLSDSSQHVFYQVFPDNSSRNKNNGGCEFQYRMENGADMKAVYPDIEKATDKFNVNYPETWIRLIRKNDVFESWFSKDNTNWVLYSSFTMQMPRMVYVGLALTSHNKKEYTTAEFSEIQFKK